jgi:hypothetical protein
MSIISEVEQRKKVLESLLPDSLFTGSIEDVQARVNDTVTQYEQRIPQIPEIPSIQSLTPRLIPPVPSYAEIKELVHNKIKAVKQQQQEAFIESQRLRVEAAKDSFGYRAQIVQATQATENVNNVLGRFNS